MWVRIGLSLVVAGFGIVKFLGNNDKYKVFVSFIGILFVLLGIGVYVFAFLTYRKSCGELHQAKEEIAVHLKALSIFTIGLIVSALFVIILLLLFG